MLGIATALVLVAGLSPLAAGHWEGTLTRGDAQLPVRIDIAADGAHGTFSAPDVGAVGVPLSAVRAAGPVHFELVGDRTTTVFDATVTGDAMTGTFRENGAREGVLHLRRVPDATARPYDAEPITFANGDVRLSGTVFVPRTPGPHPAAVLVHGSGDEGRWATAPIADALARNGVVALAYDKRGVGASGGNWRTSTLRDLAGDARAAVHALALRADVDRARLGVYGHSQGAEIAPEIARDDAEVRWIAAADGPVGPEYRQDLFRVDTALATRWSGDALTQAEALYAEFVDVARNGAPHERLRADLARAARAPWLDELAIPADESWIWAWYAKVGNYDNTAAWSAVRVPVLLLFGADDRLVPPQASIDDVVRILRAHGNDAVTVRTFAGADHTLHVPPANVDGWPHFAPGFPDAVAAFAQHPGRTTP